MYSGLPTRNRIQVQTALGAGWLLAAGVGASMVAPPPDVLEELLGFWPALASGSTLIAAALAALFGVVFRRYIWEWSAAWIAAAALLPYAVVAWTLCVTVSGLHLTTAFLATSLLAFFASRAVLCSAHAAKLRVVHSVTTAVIEGIVEGDEGDIAGMGG